ncbi:hypothetical protein JQ597_13315 [Bradyrhizobium sp. AUGA SZCCT0177]|uniref:hypothetical protein n=1 Tax=Bradyrhizobium sp. AUGA SZCCT0177 TaxID=2807665 RepID=UPI001BA6527A|nr:hypothetical protein [Bradyrhizobium sp. AUGA SZCCT0177]MBR1283019.1 hypothetical protein [Bradyrhizobium sp. AUGA SZCCT0177]
MSNEVALLNDAELEGAFGGIITSNTRLDGIPPVTTLSRVKTSDKQQQAVLAFIKG